MAKQDVDKIVRTIEDFAIILAAYKKAKEDDGKVSWTEWIGLTVGNIGKVTSFIGVIGEIKEELIDTESEEAAEIWEAIKGIYDPENPYVDEGIQLILEGALSIKEGAIQLTKAKDWEKPE